MEVVSWVVFGLIAGSIAKMIHPGKDPGGFIMTIIIGIVGAMVGGLISKMIGFGEIGGFNLKSFIFAVIGSILLLAVYRMVKRMA